MNEPVTFSRRLHPGEQEGNVMEVTAEYRGIAKFEVAARCHRVMCDQPVENGGTDEGMTPPEFLLASLSTCGAYYAAQFLKVRGLPVEGLQVRVSAEKALKPARLASFRISVTAPGLDAAGPAVHQAEEGLLRAVNACLIHNTLLGSPTIEVEVEAAALAQV